MPASVTSSACMIDTTYYSHSGLLFLGPKINCCLKQKYQSNCLLYYRNKYIPFNSILVEMGPDMVESFHGEELFRSEPLVCIVSQDQRFHMESYFII